MSVTLADVLALKDLVRCSNCHELLHGENHAFQVEGTSRVVFNCGDNMSRTITHLTIGGNDGK
jgi:hypothetical protein